MDLSRALALAADGRDRALADLIALVRIPSISTDPAYAGDVARAADWLAERLRALGLDVTVEPGDPHPVVCAEWMGRPGAAVLGIATTTCSRPTRWSFGTAIRSSRSCATVLSPGAACATTRGSWWQG